MRKDRIRIIAGTSLILFLFFSIFTQITAAKYEEQPDAVTASNPWLPAVTAKASRDGEVEDKIKRIALTFDDGPHAEYTPALLDLLKKYNVHATFFVVGTNVSMYPEIVQREISEGHEIGNHTNTHPCAINRLDEKTLKKELLDAENAIYEVADYRPHLFRPPCGLQSIAISNLVEDMDYKLILWSIDTLDWNKKTSLQYVLNTVRKNIKDGSIILCHDYVVREKSVTIEALDILIPELLSQGYEFVLASELTDCVQN